VIQWTGVQEYETIATAAGQYGSPYHAEMFAIYKALEVMVEKLTDSTIVIRIHSDSRHALQQLATGPALQDDRIGCKIWQKLVAISQRNSFRPGLVMTTTTTTRCSLCRWSGCCVEPVSAGCGQWP